MLSRNACIAISSLCFLMVVSNFINGLASVDNHDDLWLIGVKFSGSVVWSASCAIWALAARNRA